MSEPQAAATPIVITPSERVLLLGDRFSEPAGMLSFSEVVLASGNKVKVDRLVHNAVLAALLAAEQSGGVGFETRQDKALFGLMKTQKLHLVPGPRQPSWPQGTLEWQAVAGAQRFQPEVDDWLSGIIADKVQSPEQRLCAIMKGAMAQRGVLAAHEKKTLKVFTTVEYEVPPATRAALEQSGAAHVEEMLRRCQQERPQLWNELLKKVKASLVFMTQSND